MAPDLLAALAAARWLGRDFINSITWRVAVVTGGLAVGEELELPLDTTRGQCHPTARAFSDRPQSSQNGLAQAWDF